MSKSIKDRLKEAADFTMSLEHEAKDEMKEVMIGDISFRERVCDISLWYPRVDENVNEFEINLMDVRGSDGVRVSYDFERDGWVVKQPKEIIEANGDESEEWIEVGFFHSWHFDRKDDKK